jgi:protease I
VVGEASAGDYDALVLPGGAVNLDNRTLTSYPSVRTDIRNAGGKVVDAEVVTDQNITSSRWPDDLPAFCARIIERFAASS